MKQLGFAQPTEMLRGLHFYTHHQRIYPTAFLKATVNVLFTGYVFLQRSKVSHYHGPRSPSPSGVTPGHTMDSGAFFVPIDDVYTLRAF